MKTLFLALYVTSIVALSADTNLLKNGDFSSGSSHWEGDGRAPESSSADFNTPATSTKGIVVKLRHLDWTKVMQDFDGGIGTYKATIKYSVSPDLKLSTKPEDYLNITSKVDFSRLKSFKSEPGKWVVIINDLGNLRYTYWKISPNNDSSAEQTVDVSIQLDSEATMKKGFYLIFPPGEGTITLHSISLTPASN